MPNLNAHISLNMGQIDTKPSLKQQAQQELYLTEYGSDRHET